MSFITDLLSSNPQATQTPSGLFSQMTQGDPSIIQVQGQGGPQVTQAPAQPQPSPVTAPAPSQTIQDQNQGQIGLGALPNSNAVYQEQDPSHQGLLGAGRNVLGFLTDFLMSRLHMPQQYMYAPSNEARQLSAAEQGFGTTPQATADAISRVGSLSDADSAQQAMMLRDKYIAMRGQQLAQQSTADLHNSMIDKNNQTVSDKMLSNTVGYLNSIKNADPATYAAGRSYIANSPWGKANPDDLAAIPDNNTDPTSKGLIQAFADSRTSVGKQITDDQGQQRIDNQVAQYSTTADALKTYRDGELANGRANADAALAKAAAMGTISQADMQRVQTYRAINSNPDGTPIRMASVGGQRAAPMRQTAGPPVGTINAQGKSFQGGDYTKAANWR